MVKPLRHLFVGTAAASACLSAMSSPAAPRVESASLNTNAVEVEQCPGKAPEAVDIADAAERLRHARVGQSHLHLCPTLKYVKLREWQHAAVRVGALSIGYASDPGSAETSWGFGNYVPFSISISGRGKTRYFTVIRLARCRDSDPACVGIELTPNLTIARPNIGIFYNSADAYLISRSRHRLRADPLSHLFSVRSTTCSLGTLYIPRAHVSRSDILAAAKACHLS